jgi:hypothetical protein
MELEQALKIVRAAGYRVSKPKLKKMTRVGPTCVVTFEDGITCRMSTHTSDDAPDFERGIKLAQYAWEARKRRPMGIRLGELKRQLDPYDENKKRQGELRTERDNLLLMWVLPYATRYPEVAKAHFERDGKIIATYA